MSNSEIAFDKLTCLIEDTNTLLINEFTFGTDDFEVLKEKINIYFDKYEYKPNIVKGITSTIPHKELLKNCEVYKEIALSQLSKEELDNA